MSVIIFCYLGTIIIFLVVTNLFLLNLFLISNHFLYYMKKLYLIGLAIYKFSWSWQLVTSAPLCVIDGVIADATVFSNLDPNIIKSISILKDAASSAIYGSRAAYGVVLSARRSCPLKPSPPSEQTTSTRR